MLSSSEVCFVTPSYGRDYKRCELLVESKRVCCPEVQHYLVVDPGDVALFRQLSDRKTTVVDARELLDGIFYKLPGRNGWWLSPASLPLRGWISQQIRKLAMPRIVDHKVLVNVDSDVAFTRAFGVDVFFQKGRLGLFEVDFRNEEIERWSALAAELLDISRPNRPNNYVGMMIPWWREEVVGALDKIEENTGVTWQLALARLRTFSEYMVYGTYIREVRGVHSANHFSDDRKLVEMFYDNYGFSLEHLEERFSDISAGSIAVMVHSKDSIEPETYRRFIERMWSR